MPFLAIMAVSAFYAILAFLAFLGLMAVSVFFVSLAFLAFLANVAFWHSWQFDIFGNLGIVGSLGNRVF